jgi:hypothetical protein
VCVCVREGGRFRDGDETKVQLVVGRGRIGRAALRLDEGARGAWGFVSIRRRGATGEPLDLFSFVSSVRPGGEVETAFVFFFWYVLCVAAGDSSGGRLSLRLAEGISRGLGMRGIDGSIKCF